MNTLLRDVPWVQGTRIILLIVSLVPLVVSTSFVEPYTLPRTLLFLLLVGGALVGGVGSYLSGGVTIRFTTIHVIFLALIALGIIATLVAPSPSLSFMSTPDRMEGLCLWIALLVYTVLLTQFFDARWWRRWCVLNLSVAACIAFFGFGEYGGSFSGSNSEGRIQIFFGNPVFYGAYMLGGAVLATCVLLSPRKGTLFRYGAGVLVLLTYGALALSGTRSVLLGVIGGLVVALVLCAYTARARVRAFMYVGGICVILAVSIGGLFALQEAHIIESSLIDRFRALGEGDIRTQARYYHYTAALDGLRESPFFGHGFEGFAHVFERHVAPEYYGDHLSSTPEPWSDRVHNEYLDLGVSIGIPGALVFSALLVYLGILLFRTLPAHRTMHIVLLGALTAYSIHLLFNFAVLTDLLFLAALIAYGATHDTVRYVVPKTPHALWRRVVLISLTTLTTILLVVLVWDRALFAYHMKALTTSERAGTYDRLMGAYTLGVGTYIDAPYAREDMLVSSALYGEKIQNEEKRTSVHTQVRALEAYARDEGPLTPRDFYYYGMAYTALHAYDDAVRVLREGLVDAPQRLHLLNALSRALEKGGESQRAIETARESYTLEPTYNESSIRYASALIVGGDEKRAREVLLHEFGTEDVLSLEIIKAYIDAGQFDRAEALIRGHLKKNSENEAYWDLLLMLYQREGNDTAYESAKKEKERALRKKKE